MRAALPLGPDYELDTWYDANARIIIMRIRPFISGLILLAVPACFTCGTRETAPPPDPGYLPKNVPAMRITPPSSLFQYAPWAGAPKECASPDEALKLLETEISAGGSGCTADRITLPGYDHRELVLLCTFAGEAGCSDVYRAQIWTQRDGTAPNGRYEIMGIATLFKTCPDQSDEKARTYPPRPEVAKAIEEQSNTLKDLLREKCAPSPHSEPFRELGATSTQGDPGAEATSTTEPSVGQ